MSTGCEDRLVNLMSRWLAGHATDAQLRGALDDVEGLTADQAGAARELAGALDGGARRQELEVAVREALEALAFG